MIKLYTYKVCPYCEKVRKAFAEMGIEYQEIRAEYGSPESQELIALGGKGQVPFLLDEDRGVQMYESDDIIAYAKENLAAH